VRNDLAFLLLSRDHDALYGAPSTHRAPDRLQDFSFIPSANPAGRKASGRSRFPQLIVIVFHRR
jgi:hypothetical protein